MAPGKWGKSAPPWDTPRAQAPVRLTLDADEEADSTPPSSPPQIARRKKFEDEEEDSDVADNWDEAEDSEVEREKAKKAAAAKATADAEAAKNKKSKAQRIEERRQENMKKRMEDEEDTSSDEEDDATRRERMRRQEQDSDLKHAEDLFSGIGVRKRSTNKAVLTDPSDPSKVIDLAALPLFSPSTKDQFTQLREIVAPLIAASSKKGPYSLFVQEFAKQIAKDLPSDQIKKIASGLTTLSNEKLKEEKAAEKGGKKTKAAKNKAALNANRDVSSRADTNAYDDAPLDE
jgi:translation initiation factor 3 subunit J